MPYLPTFRMFKLFLCLAICVVFVIPVAFARGTRATEGSGQEASPSQAQATMASLFGRGSKMPVLPRMGGTIALPSFDSSKLKIDEGSLSAAQRGGRGAENGERSS